MKILFAAFAATLALADTPPAPKVFKGMSGQKGQYQVDVVDGSGRAPQRMTVCTDNPARPPENRGGDASCKYRLLRDTADEAVMESTCSGRTSTVTMRRESASSMLMIMETAGAKGPQTIRMRYTHTGPCREGQGVGAVTLDPNSEQCRKLKEQAARMKDRKTADQLAAMCR